MTNINGDRGAAWESDVAEYLRGRDIPAVRARGAGTRDTGDLDGLELFAVECKDQKRHVFFEWLVQAKRQATNARKPFGAVVIKKRDAAVPDAAVLIDLSTFAMVLNYIDELKAEIEDHEDVAFLAQKYIDHLKRKAAEDGAV